jgi:murein DD-endopeptidase MepM/ murein hydrolase activator NlpD
MSVASGDARDPFERVESRAGAQAVIRGESVGRERLGRAVLLVALGCTLIVPTAGSQAGPGSELERTREELEEVRSTLEYKSERAGDAREEIDVLERDINRLQIAIEKLDEDIADVEADVRDAENAIADTQKRIDAVEDLATEQAVALYKSAGVDVLGALLSSTSLAELDARAQLLGIAAEQNTGALIEYGRLKVRIEAQARELFAKQELLTEKRAARTQLLADHTTRKERLDQLYVRLSGEITHLKHREGDLEAEAKELRDEILASQAAASVQALGTSAQGFIWPLNGPITSGYGPRWGRMHTGIDIDGYTGQPIVASKSGTVIVAAYYSGYGNAVIIDHGGGIATLYGHMSAFGVSNGNAIEQGTVVGNVGCTGSCTGDHLHFEVRVNGDPVNPLDYLP